MIGGTPKVIFDTNSARCEPALEHFFNHSEMEKFAAIAEIYLPEIVIEEIRAQKERHFSGRRQSFLENIFHKLRGVSEEETKNFDISALIKTQEDGETVSYTIIALTDFSVLPAIKSLALQHKPPFENGSDKGFKDAYILFTVLEFLKGLPKNEQVFFVTNDERLEAAFSKVRRVRVVKDFDDFQRYRTGYFQEEYFIKKLQGEVDAEIKPTDVKDAWLNINGNWVVFVEKDVADEYRIEVDFATKEIIGWTDTFLPVEINSFEQSGAFQATHDAIEILEPFLPYFSDGEFVRMAEAAVDNSQIYRIRTDPDVKAFIDAIWDKKANVLPKETREQIKSMYLNQ